MLSSLVLGNLIFTLPHLFRKTRPATECLGKRERRSGQQERSTKNTEMGSAREESKQVEVDRAMGQRNEREGERERKRERVREREGKGREG